MQVLDKIGVLTIQGLLAMGGFGVLCWGFAVDKVPIEALLPLAGAGIGFFFAQRKANNI